MRTLRFTLAAVALACTSAVSHATPWIVDAKANSSTGGLSAHMKMRKAPPLGKAPAKKSATKKAVAKKPTAKKAAKKKVAGKGRRG